jgi:hypothetical protein
VVWRTRWRVCAEPYVTIYAPDITNGKSPIHDYDYALKLVTGRRSDAAREEQIATSRPYMDRHEIGIIPGNGYISAVGSFVCLFLPSSSDCRSRWSLAISDGLPAFISERINDEANASPELTKEINHGTRNRKIPRAYR